MKPENNKKGGVPARLGFRFAKDIDKIKDQRLINGKSKKREATEKITNLISQHELWKKIMSDSIEATKEEVNEYGK